MLLIADSGSTKTAWRLVDGNKKIHHFLTDGLNPFYKSHGEIIEEISAHLISHFPKEATISRIFFYGAGCSSKEKCALVKDALMDCFPSAIVVVDHDIIGAARATCGDLEGIICILGTGSNTCLYDGKKIVNALGGLGYILGDEGSGAHMGKSLLSGYINREMPDDIKSDFETTFRLTKEEIYKRVYEKPLAARFLASFSRFMGEHRESAYITGIIEECLDTFMKKYVCRYPNYNARPVHFVGSIAFHYSDILKKVAAGKGITVGKILPYPVEELTLYHLAHK